MDIEFRLDTLEEVKTLIEKAILELENDDEYIFDIAEILLNIETEIEELQEKLNKIWEKESKAQNEEFERSRI